ncbi:MAG: hypothetical protein ABI867_34810 [Kofleriaceae bacterium]
MLADASLPLMVSFIAVTLVTLGFAGVAVRAAAPHRLGAFAVIAAALLAILAGLAASGFFLDTPARFGIVIGPPILAIILAHASARGRRFLDALPLATLTYLHVVRVAVELILVALAARKLVPDMMTFEGRNFDIVAGLTAPIIGYLVLRRRVLSRRWLLVWNLAALALLVHVVAIAILSAPLPFQQLNFDQPTLAVLAFPFVWLPGVIVPIVLASHLVALRRLARSCGADLPLASGPEARPWLDGAAVQDPARGHD